LFFSFSFIFEKSLLGQHVRPLLRHVRLGGPSMGSEASAGRVAVPLHEQKGACRVLAQQIPQHGLGGRENFRLDPVLVREVLAIPAKRKASKQATPGEEKRWAARVTYEAC
jgi:hypothetical protein